MRLQHISTRKKKPAEQENTAASLKFFHIKKKKPQVRHKDINDRLYSS